MYVDQAQALPKVVVEIDIFSGRPNPHWTPTSQDVAQIMRLLRAGSTATAAPTSEKPLGFRGFVLDIETGAGRRRLHVHDGVVRSEQGTYLKVGQGLEAALIAALPHDFKRRFGSILPKPAP